MGNGLPPPLLRWRKFAIYRVNKSGRGKEREVRLDRIGSRTNSDDRICRSGMNEIGEEAALPSITTPIAIVGWEGRVGWMRIAAYE